MSEPKRGWASLWPLDPEVVFLNHGSFGACPQVVLDHQAELRNRLENQPVDFLVRQLPRMLEETRLVLAEFLGCKADGLALVRNATAGVNAVLRSLPLRADDELVVTNHAYTACRNALDFVAERAGARVRVAEIPFPLESADQVTEAVLGHVSSDTRLVLIDHVTSPTGLVLPIEQILGELRSIDVLIDGAHASGMLEHDLGDLAPAYYAGNCHKWICAPKGSGFLYVRSDRRHEIRPTSISHGATKHAHRSRFLAEFDWTGTDDPTAVLSISEAIRSMGSLLPGGWAELMERNRLLALEAQRVISDALSIARPCPEEMVGSMAAFPITDSLHESPYSVFHTDPLQRELISRFRIEVPIETWPEPPRRVLRVSAQLYNRSEQYERLAEALVKLL